MVIRAGQVLIEDLPVTGTVRQDGTAWVRWAADLEIPVQVTDGDRAVDVRAVLERPGVEVRLSWDMDLAGTTESVPIGRVHADTVDDDGHGRLRAHLVSREAHLTEHVFEHPWSVAGDTPVVQAITGIIRDTLPQAEVENRATRTAKTVESVFSDDHGQAVQTLAGLIPATVHTDGTGRWILRDTTPGQGAAPVWEISGDPLESATVSTSREDVVNRWIVRGQDTAGPLQAGATDTDPTSPTLFGDPQAGAWGKSVQIKDDPAVSTLGQARAIAASLLATTRGLSRRVTVTAAPCPALEPGDLVMVRRDPTRRDLDTLAVIDSITLPVNSSPHWTCQTRQWLGTVQ
jgi:hypothetical protein